MENIILDLINDFEKLSREEIVKAMPQNKYSVGKATRTHKYSKADYYNFIGEENYFKGNFEEALKNFNTALFIYDDDKVFFVMDENNLKIMGDAQARRIAKDGYSNNFFIEKEIIILNRAKVLYELHEYKLSLQDITKLNAVSEIKHLDKSILFEIKKLEFDNYYSLNDFENIIVCGELLKQYLDDNSIEKISLKMLKSYEKVDRLEKVVEILNSLNNSNDEYIKSYIKKNYGGFLK